MSQTIFEQNFTGSAGADVTTLTPQIGSGAWTDLSFSGSPLILDGAGGAYSTSASLSAYENAGTIPANATVAFTIKVLSALSTPAWGVTLCQSTTADTSYNFRLFYDGTNWNYQLYKFVAGTPTLVANALNVFIPSAGDTITFSIPPRNGSNAWAVTVAHNGGTPVACFASNPVDATLTGIGPIGLRCNGVETATTGLHVTNITVTTPNATTLTLASPTEVGVNAAFAATVSSDGIVASGTATVTPSGSAATGLSPVVITYTGGSSPQTASFTPTVTGSLVLTLTTSTGLTIAGSPITVTVAQTVFYQSGVSGFGTGLTGTVGYQVYANGVASGSRVTSGITEYPAGSGSYGSSTILVPIGTFASVYWDNGSGSNAPVDYAPTPVPYTLAQILAGIASGSVGSVTGNVGGSVASVTSPVTVGTNNDKTGYSLATAPPTAATITSDVVAAMATAPVGSVASPVSINLAQNGLTPRTLDTVDDALLTVGDALVAAIASAAGKEAINTTTNTYQVQTPSTGTVIRTFNLSPSVISPTSRS